MMGRIMSTSHPVPLAQRCPRVLIPGLCEYVTLHGKRNFADMLKSRVLNGEITLDYPDDSSEITGSCM